MCPVQYYLVVAMQSIRIAGFCLGTYGAGTIGCGLVFCRRLTGNSAAVWGLRWLMGMGWRFSGSGYLLVFAGVLMFASQATVAKILIMRMGVFSFYVFVSPLCALVAFAFCFALKRGGFGFRMLRKNPAGLLLVSVFLALNNFLMSVSLGMASASDVVILYYVYPLLVVVLDSAIFRVPLTGREVLGVLLGFVGVVVFATGGTFVFRFSSLLVDSMVLVSSFSWVLYLLVQKRFGFEEFSSNGFAFLFSTFYPLPFFAVFRFLPHGLVLPGPRLFLLLVYFGLIGSLGNVAYVKGLKRLRAVNVALLAYLTPSFSIALNWLVLGEAVGWPELVPLLLVFLGYTIIDSNRHPRGGP